jgi:putative copper export protein/methionine-rich copper-binding protein CopC
MHRMFPTRPAVGLGLVLLLLLVGARPASAHTALDGSSPASGATVEELTHIELRFSEAVEVAASHVWIEDPAGFIELSPVSLVAGSDRTITVPTPRLGDGDYAVTWHALARDGAPAQGRFTFSLAANEGAAPPATLADPAADFPPDTSLAIAVDEFDVSRKAPSSEDHGHAPDDASEALAHGLLDASLATLVGGLAFVVAVWPQGARLARTRQVLWIAALLAAFTSFELAAFQHAAATGLSTVQALSPWHQWQAMQFRFGRIAAARLVLLGAAAVLTGRLALGAARTTRSVRWCTATTLVGLGLAETLAMLSHSSTPGAFATGARLLHVIGVSVWIGGLVMLLCVVLPRRRVDELLTVLPKFAALATAAVLVLTVGGLLLAIDLVGTPSALSSTGYGRMLLAKIAVVGVLLYVASISRRHVRTSLAAPDRLAGDSLARPLAVWVGTEVGLISLILALTALLVSRIPPG